MRKCRNDRPVISRQAISTLGRSQCPSSRCGFPYSTDGVGLVGLKASARAKSRAGKGGENYDERTAARADRGNR
jgi:hypothetical protein